MNVRKDNEKNAIVEALFPDHIFLCVCICWTCYIPPDGTTPLYISACNGHKEVVEVLLQNSAEVNTAAKIVSDEWSDLIQ